MPASARAVPPKPVSASAGEWRERLAITSRSLAAIAGGYLLANLFVPAFTRVIPMAPRDASQLALMLSFIVFALAVIWAFACRDALRAWAGILFPTAICALILWLIPVAGA